MHADAPFEQLHAELPKCQRLLVAAMDVACTAVTVMYTTCKTR